MWVRDTQNIIYTIIKTRAKKILDPNTELTTTLKNNTPSKFPTVFFHFMPSAEVGNDLAQDGINAFVCTMQVKVFVTKDMGDDMALDIAYKVLDVILGLRFQVAMMPEVMDYFDTKQAVFRVRRTVGFNDIIGG